MTADLFTPDAPDGRVVPAEVTAAYVPDGGYLTVDDLVDFLDVCRRAGVPGDAPVRVRGRRRVRRLSAAGDWAGRLP